MSVQRHVIKRQIIELHVRRPAEAQRWQDEISRVYRQRVVPLIDQLCNELSEPDRLYQIETLELDLGVLDPDQLEAEFVAKVSTALRQALATQIAIPTDAFNQPGENPKVTSQLELFAHFARTGTLLWWADTAQPRLLEECLQALISESPEPLRQLLRTFAQESRPLRRLVAHYADEWLIALAGLLAPALKPAFADDLPALIEMLQQSQVAPHLRPTQRRQRLWMNLLDVASVTGAQTTALATFYQTILNRVAAELGVPVAMLLSNLYSVWQKQPTTISPQLRQILTGGISRATTATTEALAQTLAAWLEAGGSRAELLALLQAFIQQRSTLDQTRLNNVRQAFENNLAVTVTDFRNLLAAIDLSADEGSALTQQLHALEPTTLERTPTARVSAPTPAMQAPALSVDDVDELYIDNAGLVLLWPFLEHFFARLDLLEDGASGEGLRPSLKQFRDESARQRAVGLLQYLAIFNTDFPEYHLPLNKVLCGMELTEVFDFGPPLSDQEAEECTNLLTAVIEHAPILRSMSIPGLQGTFLLRQGVLRTRDGAWLLQVERETYDIVLERFPWSWTWVKLPWMDDPLQVEWV